ncbi:MAG: tRNA (adenosine(37)-N6)-dimethylallyltransferase MiaA [Methylococcales symbiont of Hymedesmia sp. n. MRB-2018]|nr:MAG: tRNA (adenosine(37)-N6)-dimethylallyltransferase MiaA [Methylococcales symbiont of Hymedesmia sp. n. MRB-2018]KAF3983234.1 MAG: tRNA (adenosine(37)-N6)-dimethylallyltransferase MiaA [Methylococcales symbiont of Hymedesmia sp. n. MRB-2018]
MYPSNFPPAIFLMGPTASGKSDLAIQLADQFNGEIISVDSALVYQGMDIGTAKPTLEERAGIAHYLIDILDPAETYSTGSFRQSALQLMEQISGRGKIPILVGGTMLYFNTLLKGLANLPEANPEIRRKLDEELAKYGKQALFSRLRAVDPESAERIHPNDPQRIQRALEVYEISGQTMSHFFHQAQAVPLPYRKIKCIISTDDRALLHERIAMRFKSMIADGFIDEVSALYLRGDLSENLPAIRAVGYRQAWAYLNGEYDLDSMIEKGIIATRQLAKKQYTWLRREVDYMQINAFEKDLSNSVIQRLKSLI